MPNHKLQENLTNITQKCCTFRVTLHTAGSQKHDKMKAVGTDEFYRVNVHPVTQSPAMKC